MRSNAINHVYWKKKRRRKSNPDELITLNITTNKNLLRNLVRQFRRRFRRPPIDRLCNNISDDYTLVAGLTHFAETAAAAFHADELWNGRGLITYLIRGSAGRKRGNTLQSPLSVEDTARWWTSGLCNRHASEWRIIKSQHRCAPPPDRRQDPPGKGEQEQTLLNERSFSRYHHAAYGLLLLLLVAPFAS